MAKRDNYKNRKKGRKPIPDGKGSRSDRRNEEIVDTALKSMDNDVEWYTRYPQLVIDSASIPFANPVGSAIQLNVAGTVKAWRASGIMTLYYQTTPGVAVDGTAPVNIAARNIYSFIRHANSGSANYEAPDLMMYLLAMDAAEQLLEHARRVYGVARLFSPTNRYYPSALLTAMGMDPDDVYANLAQLRYAINTYTAKLGSMAIPASMPIFTRHKWMAQGVYVDSDTTKPQTYIMVPDGYWSMINTGNSGTKLQYTTMSKRLTVTNLINIMNDCFDPIVSDEDMNIMSGDILKAFKDATVVRSMIPEDYTVLPSYSKEVLTEIENATVLGATLSGNVTQNPDVNAGYIQYRPTIIPDDTTTSTDFLSSERILNFHWDSPTPADVMVATRLMSVAIKDISSTDPVYYLEHSGCEVVIHAYMTVLAYQTGEPVVKSFYTGILGGTPSAELVRVLTHYSQFDWAPLLFRSGESSSYDLFGDVDVVAAVSYNTLHNIHEAALISLYDVPQIGLLK